MTPIVKQLEERMAAIDQEFGRRRRPFVPHVPGAKRDHGLRLAVHEKLGIPTEIAARILAGKAFKAGDGSYGALLVCRTSAVIEQCMFGGIPSLRASLVDLAAFALIWADCVEVLSRPTTSPKTSGAPR